MTKQYITININCPQESSEILIAALSDTGYDSFWENDEGFEAYVEEEAFDEETLKSLISQYSGGVNITYTIQKLEEKNWNVEWESNFEPIIVEDACLVRADFHQIEGNFPYEIVINPKMSFGTGHHATTYLMLQWQLEVDQNEKKVMDAGCGTGILAIMAEKKGAKDIVAFDNNEWSVENSKESFEINNCDKIRFFLGTVADVNDQDPFDIILANINRNVLLEEMNQYSDHLTQGGQLLLSGFYNYDAPLIQEKAEQNGLVYQGIKERNDWVSMLFTKS